MSNKIIYLVYASDAYGICGIDKVFANPEEAKKRAAEMTKKTYGSIYEVRAMTLEEDPGRENIKAIRV